MASLFTVCDVVVVSASMQMAMFTMVTGLTIIDTVQAS
jgi:hypothetical protein